MIEILAPAGGFEQLKAAVCSGADAVYLGARGFNARQNAENFLSLGEAVSYCHARGVSVHVTVNTLVSESELPAVRDTLREVAEAGADAVIVQDLAVARLARECCPTLALHASTQLTVHNLDGVRQLEKLGFRRVVLSRELSLEEIRRICRETELEVECFIHGALCMSLSGACYLSSMLGGRSGNRGLCAQPCRLDFRCGKREYALSLKDACNIPHLKALEEAGVASLKIEGRMKRPEYVAAATTACVTARNGGTPDLNQLQAVFSRSGFTDGYLKNRRDLNMFGTRTKEDVTAAAPVLKDLARLYRDEPRRVPLTAELTVSDTARLTLSDGIHTLTETGSVMPSDRLPNEDNLKNALCKTGGTPFRMESTLVRAEIPALLAMSELNRMRREGLDKLLALRSELSPHSWDAAAEESWLKDKGPAFRPESGQRFRLRFPDGDRVLDDGVSEILLPLEKCTPELAARFGDRLLAELPAFLSDLRAERTEKKLAQLKEAGLCRLQTDNLYGLTLGERFGMRVSGGPCLNLFNSVAAGEWRKLGLEDGTASFELSGRWLRDLLAYSALPMGYTVYGRLPLMRLRACPKNDCARCGGSFTLTDRMGIRFPVVCSEKQYQTLLNSVPLYLGDKPLPTLAFSLVYFTDESREEAEQVLQALKKGAKPDFPRTAGLYERGLAKP